MITTSTSTAHTNFVHHLAVNPSETLLASCSSDKTIQIFYREDEQNMSYNNDNNNVSCDVASANACINANCNINSRCMWALKCVLSEHNGPIFCLAWCPHFDLGSLLIAAGADRFIYMYRFIIMKHENTTEVEYERLAPLSGLEKDVITDIAFVPRQGEMLMLLSTSSLDGCVRVYENKRGSGLSKVRVIAVPRGARDFSVYNIHQSHNPLSNKNNKRETSSTKAESSIPQTPERHSPSPITAKPKAVSKTRVKAPNSKKKNSPSVAEETQESDGVTSFAWFPGAAERGLTLAIGTISGNCFLYYSNDVFNNEFKLLPYPHEIEEQFTCTAPIEDLKWTPPVGRRFHLLAICSRSVVFILRLNCISPSENWEKITFEVYQHNAGAVSASWSRSATQLYLVNDDLPNKVSVLQMRNPLDHQSWQCVNTF